MTEVLGVLPEPICAPAHPATGDTPCSVCGDPPIIGRARAAKGFSGLTLGRCQKCYCRLKRERKAAGRVCASGCGVPVLVFGRVCAGCKPAPRPVQPATPCIQCGGPRPRGSRGRRTCSDACSLARRAVFQTRNPGRSKNRHRGRHGRKFTREDFRALAQEQGGRCYLCDRHESEIPTHPKVSGGGLVPDHCHTTGLLRVALCRTCNILAGFLEKAGRDRASAVLLQLPEYLDVCWRAADAAELQ